MFSKFIKIIIPIILIGIIILISYRTYEEAKISTESPITVIPNNAAIILQINNLKDLDKSIKNHSIFNKLSNINEIDSIIDKIEKTSMFFSSNKDIFISNCLFISLHKVSADKNSVLFSTNVVNDFNNHHFTKLFGNNITSFIYDNQTIYYNSSLDKYFSQIDNILFYSNNKMLVTDAIRTAKTNDNLLTDLLFFNSYKTINDSEDINLMINYNNLFEYIDVMSKRKLKINKFSEWSATDIKIKDDAILSNGLSLFDNSIVDFTDIFKNQRADDINILNVIPDNTTKLFAISFNKPKKLYQNKNMLLQSRNKFWSWDKKRKDFAREYHLNYDEFINEINNEAGIFNTSSKIDNDNSYTYFKTKESIRSTSLLQNIILSYSEYKNFRINKIIDNNITANLFGNLFNANHSFLVVINDYFIFGTSESSLEYIIDNYIASNTLSEKSSFKRLNKYISKDANVFFYLNPGKTFETIYNSLMSSKSISYDLDSIIKFTAFSIQMNTTNTGNFHNLCLLYDDNYVESLKEEWYYTLDTNSRIKPYFINNHFTNEKIILIQDSTNNLIALNSSGKKIWNKQIDNKILGNINFIDFYKNNKFQALFNTENQLYLIDRNGNFVDGFPKKLPITTSMGHSLFDYNNNKRYRIMIIGNDNFLYNIDKNGKKVKGWKYIKTNNKIVQPPIHFSINGKDYILEATNNTTTRLLALNGSTRVLFNESETFSSPIKITKDNSLYAITNENKLWKANVNGETEIIDLPYFLEKELLIIHNDKYYITDNNRLLIVNQNNKESINLDSKIKSIDIFEEYISIVTQTNLYLIKDYQIIKGFPILSDGLYNISDIDNNGKINIVNIKNGLVFNYELNDYFIK